MEPESHLTSPFINIIIILIISSLLDELHILRTQISIDILNVGKESKRSEIQYSFHASRVNISSGNERT